MSQPTPELPRYDQTRRRDFLRRAALLGTVGLVPGLACGNNDEEVLGRSTTTTGDASTTTTLGSTTAPSPSSEPTTTVETTTSPTAAALPQGAALELRFTYAAVDSGFGQVRNPFIAAWVESASGELVRNLALWYNPPKGNRWVGHLTSWYAADGAYYQAHGTDDLASVTGASRPAGSYPLQWDGRDESGARATQGDYVVLVESAREHGPHSLMSAPISLGTRSTSVELAADGELTGGTAAYSA